LRESDTRRPRTVFATHYHELTRLGSETGYLNLNVLVREWGDEVIFLRRVAEGAADRSYGIEVARLAGVPGGVVRRAAEVLKDLERRGAKGIEMPGETEHRPVEQLPLFGGSSMEWLVDELRGLDPDRLSPLEALALIHRWVQRIDQTPNRSV
jgi:DNA mismatch repair protein MutS